MATFAIDGIYSGLDTTALIDAIIDYERLDAVLLEAKQTEKQATISAYQALEAKYLAFQSELAALSRSSTFEKSTIAISDEGILSATATDRVATGSWDLQVLSLATNHQLASQGFNDADISNFGTGQITIQIGDGAQKTIEIDEGNNSLIGIKNAINEADLGVTASIINDGSPSQQYRLVLTGDDTGAANRISITSDLTGGSNLDFSGSSFGTPEAISLNASTTSQISLGSTASYTGAENKNYTFTVAGTGSQTIGSDVITLNWSDGTNSGSIVLTEADTEVELVGVGADGMKLSFSSGTLTAGDTFQVSSFTPVLQEPSNARIALGSSDGSGSPITITSDTNTFEEVISGLDLTVSRVTNAGESVTLTTDIDVSAIQSSVQSFIDAYNEVNTFIDEQNTYSEDPEDPHLLFGDYTVWSIQNSLRSMIASPVEGLDPEFNQFYAIGVRTDINGQLALSNYSAFEGAVRDNLDAVIDLFTNSGLATSDSVEFMSATSATAAGEQFQVDITQAAAHAVYQGDEIANPASTSLAIDDSNNRLKVRVDGLRSEEIVLSQRTYNSTAELVQELQKQIDADGKIGSAGVNVEWVATSDDTGYLTLTGSTYGASSKIVMDTSVSDPAFAALGLATGVAIDGKDVEGTINGESATGSGQFLTGNEDNLKTEGLKLKITLTEAELAEESGGFITFMRGISSRLHDSVSAQTSDDGVIESRIDSLTKQIENLTDRIEEVDERLEIRRESLVRQYTAMESALAELESQRQFLNQQSSVMNSNWLSNLND